MEKPLIKIFKPGRFTAEGGQVVEFSQADLEAVVASYDPVADPAPLVIGHPKTDDPAWGWVERLVFEEGHLCAVPDETRTDATFAEAVQKGRYAKISPSFYPADSANNPKPGSLYLKHVGFLGAKAPSVKGMGTVAFAEGDAEQLLTIDIDQQENKEMDFAERDAALDAREQRIQEREQAAAQREKEARHAGNLAFTEALIGAGKLAPFRKDLVVGLMDELNQDNAISFGESEGELTPLAAFRKLFDDAGTVINFGEQSKDDGKKPSLDPQAIADRALNFQEEERKAGRSITIAAAVRHVEREAD